MLLSKEARVATACGSLQARKRPGAGVVAREVRLKGRTMAGGAVAQRGSGELMQAGGDCLRRERNDGFLVIS